ncbi:hypothetical protein ACTXT7_012796 [Hymenolepis weldensis]
MYKVLTKWIQSTSPPPKSPPTQINFSRTSKVMLMTAFMKSYEFEQDDIKKIQMKAISHSQANFYCEF